MAWWRVLLRAALLVALAACSEQDPAQDPEQGSAAGQPPAATVAAIARCRIDVEGGLIRVAGQREGLIEAVFVEEGDRVGRGQLLARLDSRLAELRVGLALADLEEARARADATAARLGAAQRERSRRHVAGVGAVGQRQIDEAEVEAQAQAATLRAARAAVEAASRRLDEARLEVEVRNVRAPADGVILRRRARPGEGVAVQAVTELFQLAPDAPRIARCDLEELFLPGVSVGQAASIVVEADGRQTYGATVKRLSDMFGAPAPSDDPTARVDLRTLEMVLDIEAGTPLRIGQRVRATIAPRI
jgi:HlyD family secretion protein